MLIQIRSLITVFNKIQAENLVENPSLKEKLKASKSGILKAWEFGTELWFSIISELPVMHISPRACNKPYS